MPREKIRKVRTLAFAVILESADSGQYTIRGAESILSERQTTSLMSSEGVTICSPTSIGVGFITVTKQSLIHPGIRKL